jgi:hypothetical protein
MLSRRTRSCGKNKTMRDRTKRLLHLAVAATCIFSASLLSAQTEAQLLEKATDIRCTFTGSVRTTWKAGVPQPVVRTTGSLVITIRDINAASGSALLIRNPINKDLTVVADENARHFIDAGGGRVSVTAVFGQYSTGMKFKAAHFIHDYVAIDVGSFRSEPEIVKYPGECEIIPQEG